MSETMKKLDVKMKVTHTFEMQFECENKEAAEELAMNEWNEGELDAEMEQDENVEFVFESINEAS